MVERVFMVRREVEEGRGMKWVEKGGEKGGQEGNKGTNGNTGTGLLSDEEVVRGLEARMAEREGREEGGRGDGEGGGLHL